MSEKHSQAMRDRWSKIPKEKRAIIAQKISNIYWSKKSKKERRAHALRLVRARRTKLCNPIL